MNVPTTNKSKITADDLRAYLGKCVGEMYMELDVL